VTRVGPPNALVVGGSGAIGRAVNANLVKRHYDVVSTYCGQRPNDNFVTWAHFDASTADAPAQDDFVAALPNTVELVVYLVGVPSSKQPVAETDLEEFRRLYTVNALGLVALWQVISRQARAGAARVVVVSSEAAAAAGRGNGPYTASKAALESIAITLAREEAVHGVRVNVLAPSLVRSPQGDKILAAKGITDVGAYYRSLPAGRPLSLDEVAQAVTALGCDAAWDYATATVTRLAFNAGSR
jgi:3-oxoacyl-[acyl-carrier protein] reductase